MKLKDLGERRFVERVSKKFKVDGSVIKGIGDDAAVIRWKADSYLLLASDMIIEGVHFDKKKAAPFKIGLKALGVNLSDIAAMGGVPHYAQVSLGLPANLDLKFVDGIFAGINAMAGKFGLNITGGDTNRSNKIIVDVTVMGEVKKNELILRSGAKKGDTIMVTGKLGGSIKGRHLNFTPRVKESCFLVKNFNIHSMIDISDGLSSDLGRMCVASRAGARIYESLIPVSSAADSLKNALHDGEDFELLFTAPRGEFKRIAKGFRKKFTAPVTAIGEIIDKDKGIKIITGQGRQQILKESGFGHF